MLHVDHPDRPLDPSLLDSPGGFAWWYADARNPNGDGLVLILSWGLPFLPGDRAARRAGNPPIPRERPSINLALYRDGRATFYTLHTLDPSRASWGDGGGGRFGATVARFERGDREVALHVDLSVPIPGEEGRLEGTIVVRGPKLHGVSPDHANLVHAWTPVMGPARCTASLTRGGQPYFSFEGDGYADRNGSPVSLDELGLERWIWGRATVGGRSLVYYLSFPTQPDAKPSLLLWEAGPDGAFTVRDLDHAEFEAIEFTWLGMPWWRRIVLHLGEERFLIDFMEPVDTGPFYLRLQTSVIRGDQGGFGWAEICIPDRIDLAVHRPLIRMCVHPEQGPSSIWLPLFGGPSGDRVTRLLRAWRGQAPRLGGGVRE